MQHKVSVTKPTKEKLPVCPVATTVQLIGSKWKLLIIRNLRSRPWRFNELRKDLEGIGQKVLTDSLREMEADGDYHPYRLSGGAAARGVCALAAWGDAGTHS